MFDTIKFGACLSGLRKNADMTQSELADKLNVSRQAVSKYESGDSFPDISILVLISQIFNIRLDQLIHSGEPTKGEAEILERIASKEDNIPKGNAEDVVGIAPLLKPSVLGKMADGLAKQGIDISHLVALAEYMNNESVLKLLETANWDKVDEKLLEKLIPLLDDESKYKIFEKILEGEMDYHLIKVIFPYTEYLTSHIEAAVVDGVLNEEVLRIIREVRFSE